MNRYRYMAAVAAALALSVSCVREMEDPNDPDAGKARGAQIVLEVSPEVPEVTTKAAEEEESLSPADSLQGTLTQHADTALFSISLEPMDDVHTKAAAVTAVPGTLYWLASTGVWKSETLKWGSASAAVSGGKLSTGKYQTKSPTSYNYYVSNVPMTFASGGSTVAASNGTDIVVGCTGAATGSASPAVTLNHIFARTGSVTVNAPSGCTVTGVSIQIKSVSGGTSGTYNIATGSWSGKSGLTGFTALDSSSDMYLVPGTYTVQVGLTINRGGWSSGALTRSANVDLVAGKVNNLTINASNFLDHELVVTANTGGTFYTGHTRGYTATYYLLTNGQRDAGTNVTGSASWSTSNAGILTVSGGTATAVAAGSANISASYGGKSGSLAVAVTANTVVSTAQEYKDLTFTLGTIADVPRTGGTSAAPSVSSVKCKVRNKYTWADGSTTYSDWADGNPSIWTTFYSKDNSSWSTTHSGFTGADISSVSKARTKLGTIYVYINAVGLNSGTQSKDVYQEANTIYVTASGTEYEAPTFTLGTIGDIAAGGGTSAAPSVTGVSQRRRTYQTWSDSHTDYGAWETVSPAPSYTVEYSKDNSSWSTSHAGVTAATLGTTAKARTQVGTMYVRVTANGKSTTKSGAVYQGANSAGTASYEYGTVTFTLGGISDVSAAGGTSAAPAVSGVSQQRRTVTPYTSGSNAYGSWGAFTPSYTTYYSKDNSSWSTTHAGYSGSDLGYTAKARTYLGTIYVYVAANGKNAASQGKEVYQQANSVTYSDISISTFSYATPAWNSTAAVSPTLTYSQTRSSTARPSGEAVTSGFSVSYSHTNSSEFTLNTSTGQVAVNSIPSTTVWDDPVISNFGISPNPAPSAPTSLTLSFNYSQNQRRSIAARSDAVTVTVSGNGKSKTATATRTQAGNTDIVNTVSGSFDKNENPHPYTMALAAATSVTGFTCNYTAGAPLLINWASYYTASSGTTRSADVNFTFSMNGKSANPKRVTLTQAGGPPPRPGDPPTITITTSHPPVGGYTGNTVDVTVINKTLYGVSQYKVSDSFMVCSNGTNVTSSCTFSGYNSSICEVKSTGEVLYKSDGTTTITVKYSGSTFYVNVTAKSESLL